MKRILIFILTLLLALGLWGCGKQPGNIMTEPDKKVFMVGFGRADMTPDFSVGLSGYDNAETRRSTGVKDRIYMTCVAMSDGDQTILLITADVLGLNNALVERIRTPVHLGTGVPVENIFVGATHTHSAPDFSIDDAQQLQFTSPASVIATSYVAAMSFAASVVVASE